MSHIVGVRRALPDNYYDQQTLIAALKRYWGTRHHNVERLAAMHEKVMVGGRHLALPIDAYETLESFGQANQAFIDLGTELGTRALQLALEAADLSPEAIDHLFFVSVTGVATPSLDARIVNRLGLRPDIKRTPIFGLGCVAGAAGIARAHDYLRGHPDGVAALISVELCSLTLQRQDLSVANIIASGLFGDGAAAVLMVGPEHPLAANAVGPQVGPTRSVFYPNTEGVMGWDISESGFRVVLSADVPRVAREHIGADVDAFLQEQGLRRANIDRYVCHPGGPKVLEAFRDSLAVSDADLAYTWKTLRELGNLSSASVLMVLEDTMADAPPTGSSGLMVAMGPGFCSEVVLLRW